MDFLDDALKVKVQKIENLQVDVSLVPQIIGCCVGGQFFADPTKVKDLPAAADKLANLLKVTWVCFVVFICDMLLCLMCYFCFILRSKQM
jgi:hypothetical protein